MTMRDQNGINPSPNGLGHNGNRKKSPEEIEAEITQTRTAIAEDISALGDKLSPDKLREGARGVMQDAREEAKGALRDVKEAAVGSLRQAKDNAVHSVAHTVHQIGSGARRVGRTTGGFVAENAIPLSLIGLGVTWLTLSLRRRRALEADYGYRRDFDYAGYATRGDLYGRNDLYGNENLYAQEYEYELHPYDSITDDELLASSTHAGEAGQPRRVADRARERVGQTAGRVAETAGGIRQQASDRLHQARGRIADTSSHLRGQARERASQMRARAGELGTNARHQVHRAGVRTRDFANDSPLAMGAVAVAAGVGVGLMLPMTGRENEIMGPTRERLAGDARQLVNEAKSTASNLGRTARETAQELKSSVRENT